MKRFNRVSRQAHKRLIMKVQALAYTIHQQIDSYDFSDLVTFIFPIDKMDGSCYSVAR
jgi:hypothetical protein